MAAEQSLMARSYIDDVVINTLLSHIAGPAAVSCVALSSFWLDFPVQERLEDSSNTSSNSVWPTIGSFAFSAVQT
jgi:hypothetical protein